MPLLTGFGQQQQDDDQDEQQQPGIQPLAPAAPAPAGRANQSFPKMQSIGQKQAPKKATGYTNVGQYMQANVGSKLGQTIAGGVGAQLQGLQSKVKTAQQQFQEEAQKARIDTPEAAAKRTQVLGRFDESQVQPDASKYQISQSLQSQYQTGKSALEQQRQSALGSIGTQQQTLQQKLQQEQAEMANINSITKEGSELNAKIQTLTNALRDPFGYSLSLNPSERTQFKNLQQLQSNINAQLQEATAKKSELDKRAKDVGLQLVDFGTGTAYLGTKGLIDRRQRESEATRNILNQLTSQQQQKQTAFEKQFQDFESNYAKQQEAEKQAWLQAEKERLVAENLPSEQEMAEFTKYRAGAYTGPKTLADEAALLGKAAQAEELGGLTRSAGGRGELLRRFVGGRDYTSGERTLDQALLERERNVDLAKQARETRRASETVGEATQQASALAQEYTGKAKQFGEETRKQIEAARAPVAERITKQLADLEAKETGRKQTLESIQGLLSADPSATPQQNKARLGLALQTAADAGLLSQQDIQELIGPNSLIKHADALGLDINKLISERISSKAAVGADRATAATKDQEARIAALDRLMGKVGTDVEFGGEPISQYTAGETKFDIASLKDYITKTEAERLKSSPGFQAELQRRGLLEQPGTQAGLATLGAGAGLGAYGASATGTALGGGALAGAGSVAPIAAAVMLGTDFLSGGDSSAQTAESLIGLLGSLHGQKGLTQDLMTRAQGLRDLTESKKIDQAVAKLSGFDSAKSLVKNISSGFGGRKTGNWHPSELGTIDATTGKQVRIGEYKNRSSEDIMKQMIDIKNKGYTRNWKINDAVGAMNELMNYYNAAKAKEDLYNQTLSDFFARLKK